MNRSFWYGKRVFITGHTGFKGGWLALWLNDMGARVYGYALSPPTEPNFFTVAELKACMAENTFSDIRDLARLDQALRTAKPEIIFHLAAQPLVRYSYSAPVETYSTNVMGTLNLLEAVRHTSSIKSVINITSDKCYENREWLWPYRENEAIGGFDPYSSSKGCSELITAAYRRSFLEQAGIQLASARAGNVIGGGDWARDRLIPDFLGSLNEGKMLTIRSPQAIRPWQHVLEPLSGYLTLAEKLYTVDKGFAEAWNFGPEEDSQTVRWIVEYLCSKVPGSTWTCDTAPQPHEAHVLRLDSSKARAKLNWRPQWNLQTSLDMTLDWHQAWQRCSNMAEFSLQQIHEYESPVQQA